MLICILYLFLSYALLILVNALDYDSTNFSYAQYTIIAAVMHVIKTILLYDNSIVYKFAHVRLSNTG